MAAFAGKGAQHVPCAGAALLPGHKPGSNSFSSNCNHLARQRQSSVVPSVSWSMDVNDTRPGKLNAQGPKRMPQSGDYPYNGQSFESDIDSMNPFAPGIHIDLLNRMSARSPLLARTKVMVADQHKRRLKAFQKRSRDFVDVLVQYVSSSNENYKCVIVASKESANMIMEQGFISSYDQDEILDGLELIEKDIGEGKFKWRNNVDVRTNIIERLIEIVGRPAKRLDATISHYVQQLTVLQIWWYDSIDKIVTQLKELQTELSLLALRNEGLILPCTRRCAKRILLGDLVLSKIEQLEINVSRLLNYKEKKDSVLLTALPLGDIDTSKNSLCNKDNSSHIHNSLINFGNMIIGDIAYDLSRLERDLASWMEWGLLIPNDTVTRSRLLMNEYMLDMDRFTAIRSAYSIYDPVEDSGERFLGVYKLIPEVLKEAKDFVGSCCFNHENVQNFPPSAAF